METVKNHSLLLQKRSSSQFILHLRMDLEQISIWDLIRVKTFSILKIKTRVPAVAQWVTNPTSIHEDAGLIPGLTQWVKCLACPEL